MRTILLTMFLASPVAAGLPQAPKLPQAPVRTDCACATTRTCECFIGDCRCVACRKAAPTHPFSTQTTRVQTVSTPPPQDKAPGSSGATSQGVTYILVPSAGRNGFTSGGCPNGQCPNTRR